MSLSNKIREIRYAKGWGPDELAGRASISRTALYQIECGRTEAPRAGTLCRIARALGVGVETLLGSDGGTSHSLMTEDESREEHHGSAVAPWPHAEDTQHAEVAMQRASRFTSLTRLGVGVPEAERKFSELMDSPLADVVARLIDEAYRLLPSNRERSAI